MPDARWNDPRECDDWGRGDVRPRVYGERDRDDHDPRDSLIHDVDLPRGDLWVQASLDYKQRLQQLFFPKGIAYDGIRFNRTAVTAPLFNYLAPDQSAEEILVSRLGIEPRTRRLRVARRSFPFVPDRFSSMTCGPRCSR